jgi:hypothetical protein
MELKTVKATREAISKAKIILVQVRFGESEQWVKLSKIEAIKLLNGYTDDDITSMYSGIFGVSDPDGSVFLG